MLSKYQRCPIIKSYEVQNIINKLHNRKAPGKDGISSAMFKKLPIHVIHELTRILNSCVQSVYFPTEWKKAVIKPILKPNKNPKVPTNYRPISLLPSLSKYKSRSLQST